MADFPPSTGLRADADASAARGERLRLATVWLGGCSGCHMSFLDLDERLLTLAARVDLVYGPLADAKAFPAQVDVTLVEGAVATADHLELIRLPRPLRELRQRVMLAWRQMEQEGKEPDVAMLAERLGAGEEEIIEVLAAQRNSGVFSLDASRGEEGGETLGACVGACDAAYEKVEEDVFIENAIAELPPRHRRIMELRLRRGWTQTRIARELKVSQMHVSRIIREAVELLRRDCELESDIA